MKFYTFSQCGQIVPNQGYEPGVMILQFKKKGFIDMITMHSVYLPAVEVERKR